jgi:hypothetical protein
MNPKHNNDRDTSLSTLGEEEREEEELDDTRPSAAVGSVSVDPVSGASMSIEPATVNATSLEVCEKRGGWQVNPDVDLTVAEPTFMGLLHRMPT